MEIPVKPFPSGRLEHVFGGPAQSAIDVLVRARAALSPRGAWSSSGWTSKNHEGHGRCIVQTFKDVDGKQVEPAKKIMLTAVRETTGTHWESVERFNDAGITQKHHVIAALDRAIELAEE